MDVSPLLSIIRTIQKTDNVALAKIIRDTLTEFNAAKPGTVFFDSTTDDLFQLFQTPKSYYYTAYIEDKIVGGCGIFPSAGLPSDTCELVKLYLLPEARGLGLGKKLMETCFDKAIALGFDKIYLETMPELKSAVPFYESIGFKYVPKSLTGGEHFGCNLFMLKIF